MSILGGDSQGVEVALAPEELELDPMAMTQKYEEHVREQQAQVEKEDFSDMVAEHAAKQKVELQRPYTILFILGLLFMGIYKLDFCLVKMFRFTQVWIPLSY